MFEEADARNSEVSTNRLTCIKKPEDHMVLYRSPECIGYAELEFS